jgi:glycosyltransferase involved in cell wall biosynthesis
VEGRALVLQEALDLPEAAHTLSLAIPALGRRPLRVEVLASSGHRLDNIDVGGIAEWRSSWSELQRLHQIELRPGPEVRAQVRVTPFLRVASTAPQHHHYSRSLYQPLLSRVVMAPHWNRPPPELDIFHLHWPEWLKLPDLAAHQQLIDSLRAAEVPIVWTAHNLTPHDKRREAHDPIYEAWAAAASAVIHHSAWGERRMRDRWRFADRCRHMVIPHGHFGGAYPAIAPSAAAARALAERELRLPPAEVRIGVIGAPRAEKCTRAFLEGAAASAGTTQVQVVCWSLPPGEAAPASPRIATAREYEHADDRIYALRLAACDALALPVDPDGEMLGSGVVADAVGAGLAVLGSEWGYLQETLGEALIPCGHTAGAVRAALDALDPAQIAAARAAAAALRPTYDWKNLAARTADLFDSLLLDP